MLKLHFGHLDGESPNPNVWFKNAFDFKNIVDDFAKEAIRIIDKSEVIDRYCIMSPYLGTINPNDLSTGVKCVLILRYTDKIINLLNCGDNCLELIKRISLEKDITVGMSRFVT